MSRIFLCLLESFMSRICPVLFVQNLSRIFSCLEYVQFYLSRICPEFVQNFFMSRICLKKISGIFHVQNLSSLFVQILSRFFSCLEYVQNLSGFLDMKNSRRSFFQTFSRHFLDMKKKILDNFRTILMTFSGYFFFI